MKEKPFLYTTMNGDRKWSPRREKPSGKRKPVTAGYGREKK